MAAPHWQRVKELFHAALEIDAAQRAAFIARSCGHDSALRTELESLLASHEDAADFIEQPAIAAAPSALPLPHQRPEMIEGRRVGAYKLIRGIASGGMGDVYLAVRADDEFHKRVAIKIVRITSYADEPLHLAEIRRRFRNERQTLANLDHPNIARLIDGGTTEDGLPYLVMEHVEGRALDEYCDAHSLNITQRLQLFRVVCAAVHHAHCNLVVHRDLKPGNILVTAEGVPKLLDFGIAKILHPELSLQSLDLTRTAAGPMTPEYASPEQVRGQAISTASDIYAMGVVLYELLTGHRPYRLQGRLAHEMAQIICEHEPPKPSAAAAQTEVIERGEGLKPITITPQAVSQTREGNPERLRRRLNGDVDMIVLMALRKEPERRYASAEQLSEDIRRHLEGQPVIARPDTLTYRSTKFIRRHRVGVLAATLVVLALLTGLIGTLWQARLAREAQQIAEDKAQTAEQVKQFLINVFALPDPHADSRSARGGELSAAELLRRAGERIETELSDQPAIQATLMETIGKVQLNMGFSAEASRMFENALQLRRRLVGENHPEVARALTSYAQALLAQGEQAKALAQQRKALELLEGMPGDNRSQIARALMELSFMLRAHAEYAPAEEAQRQALALLHELHSSREHVDIAAALTNLSWLLRARGNLAEAETMDREALRMYRSRLGQEHVLVATAINNLAALLRVKGDFAEAERLNREALAMRRKLLGDQHPMVAASLNNLGRVLQDMTRYDEAAECYEQARAIRRARLGPDHPDVADSLHCLGSLASARAEHVRAEDMFRQALEIRRRRLEDAHPLTLETLIGLGDALVSNGKPHEAEPLLREAYDARRKNLAAGDSRLIEAGDLLGACLTAEQQYPEAEALLAEAWSACKASDGSTDARAPQVLRHLIALYQAWEKPDKVKECQALAAALTPPKPSPN